MHKCLGKADCLFVKLQFVAQRHDDFLLYLRRLTDVVGNGVNNVVRADCAQTNKFTVCHGHFDVAASYLYVDNCITCTLFCNQAIGKSDCLPVVSCPRQSVGNGNLRGFYVAACLYVDYFFGAVAECVHGIVGKRVLALDRRKAIVVVKSTLLARCVVCYRNALVYHCGIGVDCRKIKRFVWQTDLCRRDVVFVHVYGNCRSFCIVKQRSCQVFAADVQHKHVRRTAYALGINTDICLARSKTAPRLVTCGQRVVGTVQIVHKPRNIARVVLGVSAVVVPRKPQRLRIQAFCPVIEVKFQRAVSEVVFVKPVSKGCRRDKSALFVHRRRIDAKNRGIKVVVVPDPACLIARPYTDESAERRIRQVLQAHREVIGRIVLVGKHDVKRIDVGRPDCLWVEVEFQESFALVCSGVKCVLRQIDSLVVCHGLVVCKRQSDALKLIVAAHLRIFRIAVEVVGIGQFDNKRFFVRVICSVDCRTVAYRILACFVKSNCAVGVFA